MKSLDVCVRVGRAIRNRDPLDAHHLGQPAIQMAAEAPSLRGANTAWVTPHLARCRLEAPEQPEATTVPRDDCGWFHKHEALIQRALSDHHGNWSAAARSLGMHRSNFHHLAVRLGLK